MSPSQVYWLWHGPVPSVQEGQQAVPGQGGMLLTELGMLSYGGLGDGDGTHRVFSSPCCGQP